MEYEWLKKSKDKIAPKGGMIEIEGDGNYRVEHSSCIIGKYGVRARFEWKALCWQIEKLEETEILPLLSHLELEKKFIPP